MTLRKYPYKKRCVSQQQTKPFARAKDAKKETTLCAPLASIKVSFFWTDLSTKALALVRLQELSVHHVCGSYHGVHCLVIKRGRRNHQRYRTERKITGDWGEATVYTCHIWESENRMYKYLTALVTLNNTTNFKRKIFRWFILYWKTQETPDWLWKIFRTSYSSYEFVLIYSLIKLTPPILRPKFHALQ